MGATSKSSLFSSIAIRPGAGAEEVSAFPTQQPHHNEISDLDSHVPSICRKISFQALQPYPTYFLLLPMVLPPITKSKLLFAYIVYADNFLSPYSVQKYNFLNLYPVSRNATSSVFNSKGRVPKFKKRKSMVFDHTPLTPSSP